MGVCAGCGQPAEFMAKWGGVKLPHWTPDWIGYAITSLALMMRPKRPICGACLPRMVEERW